MQDILIEVNVSGEESKSGVSPDEAEALVDVCETLPNVRVRGFMTDVYKRQVMKDAGTAMMGIGIATGENRALDAAQQATNSNPVSYTHLRR